MMTDRARDGAETGRTRVADSEYRIITATHGWQSLDFRELLDYRDLFAFLIWKSLKVRYAQSILGIGWAIIQPVAQMIVFTVVFGYLVATGSDGRPYAVFALTALIPWALFSSSLTESVDSLVAQTHLVSKIYFPRMLLPLAAVISRLVDLTISSLVLAGLLYWYGIRPSVWVAAAPVLIAILVVFVAGVGLWLSALAIQYRDVRYAMGFAIQLFMYAAPIVYSVKLVPERLQFAYALNPLVGVVEGLRASVLNTGPIPWLWVAEGAVVSLAVLLSGALYFRRKERLFADVA